MFVLAIGAQVVPPSVENDQPKIAPTCPVKVMLPLFVPAHTAVVPPAVPPLEGKSTCTITLLVLGGQGAEPEIVQVNVYVCPGTNPLTMAFGNVASLKVIPVWPDVTLHCPLFGVAKLPFNVVDVAAHNLWFIPAFATITGWFTVISLAVDIADAHVPL